jgi:hypothetical protein
MKRRTAATIAAAGVGGGLLATALIGTQISENRNTERAAGLAHEIETHALADGFKAEVQPYGGLNGTRATGSIAVGPNCTIEGVTMHVDRAGWRATDVTSYSFTAHAYPVATEVDTPSSRPETIVEGSPVTFTFANIDELRDGILGNQPCQTLAGNLAVQNQIGQ